MQHLGLLRKCGATKTIQWQVCDADYVEEFLGDGRWLRTANKVVSRRHERSAEVRELRANVGGDEDEGLSTTTETLEAMAEMVAQVESLREQLDAANVRIVELEAELNGRQKDDPNDVAAALIARFKAAK